MKGYIKWIALMFISVWFMNRILGIILVFTLDLISLPNNKIQVQRDRVESFFTENGFEINIIGAYTNGREHEGPFLYGWYWDSFEIGQKGSEVVMLYYYDKESEITGYLEKLDKEERERCYLSDHFVFYYYGNDEDIIAIIKEYCEQKPDALPVDTENRNGVKESYLLDMERPYCDLLCVENEKGKQCYYLTDEPGSSLRVLYRSGKEIWMQYIPNYKRNLSIKDFERFDHETSYEDMIMRLGEPNGWVGFGMVWPYYELADQKFANSVTAFLLNHEEAFRGKKLRIRQPNGRLYSDAALMARQS